MASFLIHHIAGKVFLNTIQNKLKIKLTDYQKCNFLLGNLIVDSSKLTFKIKEDISLDEVKNLKKIQKIEIQKEKDITHFRDMENDNLCVKAPNVEKFICKYNNLLKVDISSLGYLFHLYTDKMFFGDLFNQNFVCLDINGNNTVYTDEAVLIKDIKNNKVYDISEVFSFDSDVSIYQDYTKMNKILLDKYNIVFDYKKLIDFAKSFNNPGIEEVDYNNIFNVLNETENFIEASYNIQGLSLCVFDYVTVDRFIGDVVDNFISTYEKIVLNLLHNLNIK